MSIIISGQGKLRLGLSILVVNHSEKIRSHIIKSLYEAGYFDADIWEAGNGSQGLKLYQSHHMDLILTGWGQSPGEIMDMIKNINSPGHDFQTVIIMTACQVNTGKMEEALQQGAHDYLSYPFTPAQLKIKLGKYF